MQLKKIKLAGFKSFVDPTTLELKSSLMAVVGPNGCGKSNVIDAIRWVMGESSAKNLRGESMNDVIFNGSTTRKPVGQASIELIFDNADGSAGGEYASYAEISVRRVATRDGQSSYFLNGTRCRRRDITDIFLGTGLGPRSYAIIEQGMISRVIEAKPEELRGFLEEAAGISLYRKRRQETETRMRHTRENLARLDDIRQELEKQLERLKRQSESAERYRLYKQEHDQLEVELATLRWCSLNEQLKERANDIRTLSTNLEEKLAERASLDLEFEKSRLLQTEKSDHWKVIQGQYYDLGSQVARIEQTLQHHREREQSLKSDLNQVDQQCHQIEHQLKEDRELLQSILEDWAILEPEYALIQNQSKESETVLVESESAMRQWTLGFEQFQQASQAPQRMAEVEKARIEQLEKQSREAKIRFDKLLGEQAQLNIPLLEQTLAALEMQIQDQETDNLETENKLSFVIEQLNQNRITSENEAKVLDELRSRLQSLKGRFASLEALQQAALGKTNSVVTEWLKTTGLRDSIRLAEKLEVEPGFERAVETVLGNALEAVCVPGLNVVSDWLGTLQEGQVTLIDLDDKTELPISDKGVLLAHKIKSEVSLQALMGTVFVVKDLPAARAFHPSLRIGESVITQDGIWLGPNWIKIHRGEENHLGVLARETELKQIAIQVEELNEKIETTETLRSQCQETLKALEMERENFRKQQQDQARVLQGISSKASAERARLEHVRNREARLQEEIAEQRQLLTLADEESALARMTLESALDSMEDFSKRRVALQSEGETLKGLLQVAVQSARESKEKVHGMALKQQSIATERRAIEEGLRRLEHQLQTDQARRKNCQNQLQDLESPQQELRFSLEELLSKRMNVEEILTEARSALDQLDQALRGLEKHRTVLESEANEFRVKLERIRMEWQGLEVRCQTVQEKLTQQGLSAEQLLPNLPTEAEEKAWEERLEQVSKRIERLGAINLAAIEEFQSESERKNYLDSQHKDLTEALETLENAIRKIDRETRARFKETFDKVNAEFQTLFPRLFGGGQAILELLGEDLLEAGVTVMARPPGKRNSSIHLLSGGEKALTAVAMVFAIFQLNPAPFCLLDEVDAPLDDANVGRFCELVKHMSQSVQFVFITHNKLAMEMAHHLVGVTMKEPGVSRLVSVDVEEAAALVAS